MRAVICGANGAMGKLICGILGGQAVGKVSLDGENGVARTFAELGRVEADVVIDFSHHTAVGEVLAYAREIGAAAVIGTTGHTDAPGPPPGGGQLRPVRGVQADEGRDRHLLPAHGYRGGGP